MKEGFNIFEGERPFQGIRRVDNTTVAIAFKDKDDVTRIVQCSDENLFVKTTDESKATVKLFASNYYNPDKRKVSLTFNTRRASVLKDIGYSKQ